MEIETIKSNSSMKWEMVKLGDYVERIKTWNPTIESPNEYFFYIDLSSVDKDEKIINPKLVLKLLGKDAPSRARQILKKNDVLVSTVRPNLNGVAILNQDYEKATASTGYCILRTKQDLNPLFLYYWVQNEDFVNDMILKSSGASYPAVSDKIIKDSLIPLPPLPVQKRIAEILDAADALRRKDQELLKKYDELAQAIFIDMFGSNKNIVKLSQITTKITDGVHAKPNYQETGVPFLSVKNATNKYLDFNDSKFISQADHETYTKRCKPEFEDILYTKVGATYGRAAIIDSKKEFSIYVSLALIKPDRDKVYPYYLNFVLNTNHIKSQADRRVKGAGVPDLHLVEIKDFDIPLPSYEEQLDFSNFIENLNKNINSTKRQIEYSDNLFQTLLQKAFKGELVAE